MARKITTPGPDQAPLFGIEAVAPQPTFPEIGANVTVSENVYGK